MVYIQRWFFHPNPDQILKQTIGRKLVGYGPKNNKDHSGWLYGRSISRLTLSRLRSFTADARHGVIFIWGDADSEFPICRIRRPSREDLQCSNQVPASIPALLQAQENQMGHHELQQKHTKLQIVVLNIQIVS